MFCTDPPSRTTPSLCVAANSWPSAKQSSSQGPAIFPGQPISWQGLERPRQLSNLGQLWRAIPASEFLVGLAEAFVQRAAQPHISLSPMLLPSLPLLLGPPVLQVAVIKSIRNHAPFYLRESASQMGHQETMALTSKSYCGTWRFVMYIFKSAN